MMLGSQMIPLWALALVTLICGLTAAAGAGVRPTAISKCDCNQKKGLDIEDDIHEATCCENQLDPGEGLSCCGGQAFNPEEATCCKVEDEHNKTAVTEGLSQKVSECCGLKAYNQLNEMCCQSTVVAKPVPNVKCCGTEAYDEDTHLCCGPENNKVRRKKKTSDDLCCGRIQYDPKTKCCCRETLKIHPISHTCCQEQSVYCGTKAYNIVHELCCNTTVVAKLKPNTECCGEQAYEEDTHLCCGPENNKVRLKKKNSDDLCCGHIQYDPTTECCCRVTLKIHPINHTCCQEQSGLEQQKPAPQPISTGAKTSLCGSSCYNPSHLRCCEKKQGNLSDERCCATGPCVDVAPAVYDPRTHVCCDGCVSEWKPRKDQFHRCGTEVYCPHTEICCDGHRHPKKENTHCCGPKAYTIKDPQMKCCKRRLYTLTTGHKAQCCGSILLKPSDVCCSSEDMEVLYSAKTGSGCCGHLYYNASLWSCCAGKLSPVQQPGQHQGRMIKESRRLSVNEAELCDEIQIGIMESESLHSVVFSSVLKINGRRGTVTPLDSPHILKIPDGCSSLPLTPGKTYFFDEVNIFTDFNHDSIHQSLHFIISKCYSPVATTN